MKNRITIVCVLVIPLLFVSAGVLKAQSAVDSVSQWGLTAQGKYWPITNDASTPAGSGTIKGTAPINGGGWATIQGGFAAKPITTDSAVIVTGQLKFIGATGAGSSYTPIRYAIAYEDSAMLNYQYTDSAAWSGPNGYSGYEFDPRSGTGSMANASGSGEGTVWTINNSNWNSTYANGKPVSQALQAPRNAELVPGTYNFAFSIRQVNDTTNEVKWYLVEQNNKYWFGGTVMAPATTDSINAICFGLNGGDFTEFDVTNTKVTYGSPITVPQAPWQAFYVDQWGLTSQGNYWPITNDSSTIVGNATIKGASPINGNGWATVQGGFGQAVPVKKDQALIVTGQLKFIGSTGAGATYTPLRYAIAYEDSANLNNQYTDSAAWSGPNGYSGYEFDPRTGAGTMANGNGGEGTVWTLKNGNWNSTYSNNGKHVAAVVQAPRNAEIVPGTYNFAFSIRQVNDTTNEVKWYLIEQNKKYWFGGTVMAPATTNKINSVCFGINTGDWTELDVMNTKVDYGSITVPKQPFQPFYVSDWGFLGGKLGGASPTDSAWSLTPGQLVGNTTISGSNAAKGWAVVAGGFGASIYPNNDSTISVSGDVTFQGGGFKDLNSFRLGLFNSNSMGKLDSTMKVGYVWSGDENANGYLFMPFNGSANSVAWSRGTGNVGGISGSAWYNPAGTDAYALGTMTDTSGTPTAGKYHFNITVGPYHNNGENIISIRLVKSDGSYLYEGAVADNSAGPTESFNSIMFGINNSTTTSMKLENVYVDMGDSLDTPIEKNPAPSGLPNKFALHQNYPNPFNPTTNIKFDLPKAADVQLTVYNILGQKVMTLVSRKMQAGYHLVNFNASHLASGMYIYRIKAGNFVSVKKMMLIK